MTRGTACQLSRDIGCGSASSTEPDGFEESHAMDTEEYFIIECNQGRAANPLGVMLQPQSKLILHQQHCQSFLGHSTFLVEASTSSRSPAL